MTQPRDYGYPAPQGAYSRRDEPVHFGLVRTVAATELPVSVAQFRAHLRILDQAEDSELEEYLRAAIDQVEERLRRSLCEQTWRLTVDRFPGYCELIVPRPRVLSVTSIEYVDPAGTQITWDPANYRVDSFGEPGRITPAIGQIWPCTAAVTAAVTITYQSGYGAPANVPAAIKAAIKLMAAQLHEFREAENDQQQIANPAVDRLLGPYVVPL